MTTHVNIKSSIYDYAIDIVDNSLKHIEKELSSGAFFIIDANIYRLYLSSLQEKFNLNAGGAFTSISPSSLNTHLIDG